MDYSHKFGAERRDLLVEAQKFGKSRLFCGVAFIATGASLIAYIASGVSLLLTALTAWCLVTVTVLLVLRRLGSARRRMLTQRIAIGLLAGLMATAAYDVLRFVLIAVTGIRFWPFDIFRVFGQALMGSGFNDGVTRLAGFLFHLSNGLAFGIAYAVWLGERGIIAGVCYAMFLELCMVSVYPGWLHMRAISEFMQVSVFGHIVYGGVLGWATRVFLDENR